MYTELETQLLNTEQIEGVALRYGFFYGPNTWYHPDGAVAEQVRQQQSPIIGNGQGVWSFVHIEDAARATVTALTSEPGIYNIVDNDPSPMNIWLPAFAKFLNAPPPQNILESTAREVAGEDAVYYGTKLHGASNAKARRVLSFRPRCLEWLES
jgi:nucleoside-diphosphate-sugar epimerase